MSLTSTKQIAELLDMLREKGVSKFSFRNLEVEFSANPNVVAPDQTILDNREAATEFLKKQFQSIKAEAEADEQWSI